VPVTPLRAPEEASPRRYPVHLSPNLVVQAARRGAPGPALQHRQVAIGGVVSSEELVAARAREIEQRAKAVFERCVTLDLAANITDDAAKPRAQKLQFPPRAFETGGHACSAPP